MIHPLLLAYARAERAEHAAPTDAPTGVRSPAMITHRAYAAWAEAGFPVVADHDDRSVMGGPNAIADAIRAAGAR